MERKEFKSLEECFEYYGRGNLIAIDNLRQIIFYTQNGYQPVFVYENEKKIGKIAAWFLKNDTIHIYKKWLSAAPNRSV